MLSLIPTYLIQLPILSLYLFLSLTLTCCPAFPSSPCPSSYHHLSTEQLCLHPTWSSLFHTGSIQHLTAQGHSWSCPYSSLMGKHWNFSWLLEMGPWKLYNLGSVMFNVTAASCDAESPAVFCTPATLAFSNSYKMMCLPHTSHFLYLERFFFFLIPFSFIFFSLHFHCCIFKLKFLDSPYFLQLFDF